MRRRPCPASAYGTDGHRFIRKTYMCSICLPQSGQALRPTFWFVMPFGVTSRRLASKSLHSRCQSARRNASEEAAKLVIRGLNGHMPECTKLFGWWSQTGSNRRPEACKATALPTELWPRLTHLQEAGYTIPASIWWAWEDSNFRPHAYQARALTN